MRQCTVRYSSSVLHKGQAGSAGELMLAQQFEVSYIIVFLRIGNLAADEESLNFTRRTVSICCLRAVIKEVLPWLLEDSALLVPGSIGYREWKAKIIEPTDYMKAYVSSAVHKICL